MLSSYSCKSKKEKTGLVQPQRHMTSSFARKTLAMFMLYRLIAHLDQGLVPKSQCGFIKERGAINMVCYAGSFNRNVRNKSLTCFLLMSSRQRILTLSAETICGRPCPGTDV
ncbi:hypothetical protein DPMN_075882 [Dreissena polymorpha]|uniref:Reverse transcriptase domain-containing protein n=1 Tax=Dreissena polymorpha TaxID=45954 RepID=A0A9D3YLZ7_DREPO|nr:hypothetical protein DPMN_075882 [Dreissena polymorpha]